ncbi:IMPACT family protein [Halothermothrix orenii]|uniref:Impact N-terminal domain-containing protein n=1 Tax=Halothermothrix orenii (strain H 168 / OCM 544 / DSM 9562) TaxID=373903 RepID=B8CXD3_HALOH|nr:YigZ family protein [Halothermothrix orenii]ACL69952.1 conserved hypothetical protein TIGR00257 [Halothermothrix orenii H 168]
MGKVFFTPDRQVEVVYKVKDSKFYGNISRVDSEEEVRKFINNIKSTYHDATHNVSAYKIGEGDRALKYSDDDGEPAGSSGPPVLRAIEGEGLTNTVIVVTRYFGGTKLGIGGLIRAYGNTARLAIKESGKKKLTLQYKIKVLTNYDKLGTVLGQSEAFHSRILSTEYENDRVVVTLRINPDFFTKFKDVLIELTGNRVEVKKSGEVYI